MYVKIYMCLELAIDWILFCNSEHNSNPSEHFGDNLTKALAESFFL